MQFLRDSANCCDAQFILQCTNSLAIESFALKRGLQVTNRPPEANRKGNSMTNLNLEVPAQIKEVAEKSVEQARKAFEDFVAAAQKATAQSEAATASLATGAKEVSSKAMGFAEANVKAAFDFAQKLFQVRDPKEILALQSEFLKTQLAAVQEQAKELGEAVKKAVTPSA
jgi:phasin